MNAFLIGIGGFFGTLFRYWISGLVSNHLEKIFPWDTLIINITGSFLMGLLAGLLSEDRFLISPSARDFMMIGFLGGYTTFSSFSLQTLNLMREHQWLYAGGNILLSFTCCMGAVWTGYILHKWI